MQQRRPRLRPGGEHPRRKRLRVSTPARRDASRPPRKQPRRGFLRRAVGRLPLAHRCWPTSGGADSAAVTR